MKKYFQKISHKDFLKNMSFLMGGTAVANIIVMLSAPILTHLFTPENFGVLAIMTSMIHIGCKITTLSYENAIVICSDSKKSFQVYFFCLFLCLVVVLFMYVVLLLFKVQIVEIFKIPELNDWILLLPIIIFLKTIIVVTEYLLIKFKLFGFISKRVILDSAVSNIIKIALGAIVGAWTGNLILGLVSGLIIAGASVYQKAMKLSKSHMNISDLTFRKLIDCAKEFKKFPLYNNWAVILNTVSENMGVLFFSALFTPAIVGFYSLGNRVVRFPMQYIATAFQKVYFQKVSQEFKEGKNLKENFLKSLKAFSLLLLPVYVILLIFGKKIFLIVFGENWADAGLYIQILAPGLFFVGINKPSNVIYNVLQILEVKLVYTIIFTISRALAIIIGYLMYSNILACLVFYSFTLCIFNIFYISFSYYSLIKKRLPVDNT